MLFGGPLSAVATLAVQMRDKLVLVDEGVHVLDKGLDVKLGLVYLCTQVSVCEGELLDLVLQGGRLVVEVCAVASTSGGAEVVQLFGQFLLFDFLGGDCCLVFFDYFIDPVFALFILTNFFFKLLQSLVFHFKILFL